MKKSLWITACVMSACLGCVGEANTDASVSDDRPPEMKEDMEAPQKDMTATSDASPDNPSKPDAAMEVDMAKVQDMGTVGADMPVQMMDMTTVSEFEPVEIQTAVRRVKLVLTGEPVTEDELSSVQADPGALKGLIEGWMERPAFKTKFEAFLSKTLHQDQVSIVSVVSQIRNSDTAAGFSPPAALTANLRESFTRTAMKIVEQRKPFHEIATTRTWMMTTGMMAFLAGADGPELSRNNGGLVHRFYDQPFEDFGPNTSLARQIQTRTWYVPKGINHGAINRCAPEQVPIVGQALMLSLLMSGRPNRASCNIELEGRVFQAPDFQDWREVTLRSVKDREDASQYWDVLKLRQADSLDLVVPRVGFFTTPAFLGRWRSNIDNSFRVTTNQALIVGLGESFEDSDVTIPLSDEGLAADHAAPNTACYACHKTLDPMRNFFFKEFDPDTYNPLPERKEIEATFSFLGYSKRGDSLVDLGESIAAHPRFARGWTQKLCRWANAAGCLESDLEFRRVADEFEKSNFDMKVLIAELFSSPLVTGLTATKSREDGRYAASVTRAEHLCHLLEVRLNSPNLCRQQLRLLSEAMPTDEWPRGSTIPLQATDSTLFYAATFEKLCDQVSRQVVDRADAPIQSKQPEEAATFMTAELLGLAKGDPRHDLMRQTLLDHIDAARKVDKVSATLATRSAFVLACTSPFMTSADL